MHPTCRRIAVFAAGLLAVSIGFAGLLTPTRSVAADPAGAEMMQLRLNILGQYFDIVNSFHAIADDSEKTVVFSLQQLEENYKQQGRPAEIAKLYEKILKDTKNQTLRNIAYMKLSEIHKRAGRHDEAVSLLQRAMEENVRTLK